MSLLLVTAMVCAPLAGDLHPIPVVALRDDPLLLRRMRELSDWSLAIGSPAMTSGELQRSVTGLVASEPITTATLEAWLEEAVTREAQFDSAAAAELRARIMASYDAMPLADQAASAIAAATMHEAAAAELSDPQKALKVAVEATRRFAHVPIDSRKYSPQVVDVFRRAALMSRNAETTELTLRTTAPGRVLLDGAIIANDQSTRVVSGRYVVWMENEGKRSLARLVDVRGPRQTIAIDFALERAIDWSDPPVLDCRASCTEDLAALARAANAPRAAGLTLSAEGRAEAVLVDVQGGVTRRDVPLLSTPVTHLVLEPPTPALSPLLFFPAGIGQFQQRRYAVGSAFAATQLGLAAWHIIAIKRYNDTPARDLDAERSRRSGVNLSAGLLIGAAVAGVGEALFHHWRASSHQDPP